MNTSQKKLLISILNWNGWAETRQCLRSLQTQTNKDFLVVVWDNGSSQKLPKELEREFPDVIFDGCPVNKGFAFGHNEVIRRYASRASNYVLFLNNDAELETETVAAYLQYAAELPDWGTLDSIIWYPGFKRVWFYGAKYVPLIGSVIHIGKGRNEGALFPRLSETQLNSGAAMFLRITDFLQVGMFDESFFAYYEDTKLSLQITTLGKKHYVFNIPNARIIHAVSSSGGYAGVFKFSPLQAYLRSRNSILTAKLLPLPTRLVYYLGKLFLNIPFEFSKCANAEARKAFFLGLMDGMTNNFHTTYLKAVPK